MIFGNLHFTAHGSVFARVFAVWMRIPFPVKNLIVYTFPVNRKKKTKTVNEFKKVVNFSIIQMETGLTDGKAESFDKIISFGFVFKRFCFLVDLKFNVIQRSGGRNETTNFCVLYFHRTFSVLE